VMRFRACAVVVLLAGWLLLGPVQPALAHTELVATSPGNGETVRTSPGKLVLRFNDGVDVGLGDVRVLGPGGRPVRVGELARAGRDDTVSIPVPADLRSGIYTVTWRVVSADTHPVRGAFVFTVKAPAPAQAPATVTAEPDGGPLVGVLYGVARGVAFAGFCLLVGVAYFVTVCWPGGASRRRVRRLLWTGWFGLTGATIAVLLLYGPWVTSRGIASVVKLELLSTTMTSRLGIALLVRLGLLALLVLPLVARPRLPVAAVVAGAAALAVTWGAVTHSAVGAQAPLAMTADAAHLVAMAVWLGGLVVLGAAMLPGSDPWQGLGTAVPRFSRTAMICVGVLVVSGTYQAWRQVGELDALFQTSYGRVLLAKLGLVLLIMLLAAGARSWARRHYGKVEPERGKRRKYTESTTGDIAALRRSVLGEAGIAAAVVVLAAVLVNIEPAHLAYAKVKLAAQPTAAATTNTNPDAPVLRTLEFDTGDGPTGQGSVQLIVQPLKVGTSTMHLTVVDPQGKPRNPAELKAALSNPAAAIGPLPLGMAKAGPGHYVLAPTFPLAGKWKLAVTVRTSETSQSTTTTELEVP
jgi:copper transport protein